jgi:hypothetical protein
MVHTCRKWKAANCRFCAQDELVLIKRTLEEDVIPGLRLWEYYVVNVEVLVAAFKAKVRQPTWLYNALLFDYPFVPRCSHVQRQ